MKLTVERTHPEAQLPTKAHPTDAGWDLYLKEYIEIPREETFIATLGIRMVIPDGWTGIIKDRSSVAAKEGITVLAGVIDSSYRGEVGVVLFNTTQHTFYAAPGDRIAQMLFLPVPEITIIEDAIDVRETERGEGGYGSTNENH